MREKNIAYWMIPSSKKDDFALIPGKQCGLFIAANLQTDKREN